MSRKKQIVLDCERMKYPNTGLFHYCLQLGKALQHNLDKEKEALKLYVRKEAKEDFGIGYELIHQNSLHKFKMPIKKDYDLWHCTYQSTNYFPYSKKLPTVITIHDLNVLYDPNKTEEKKAKYMRAIAKKIKYADHVVAISHFVMGDIEKQFNLTNTAKSVIYNGCNLPPQEIEEIATEKKPKAEFLFTVGTVTDKKNFHVLPPLLRGNDKYLVIAGICQSAAYQKKIMDVATEAGVQDRVILTGAISEQEKYWYIKNCEAFLFPSLAEGFGLPVVEAMYYGKPLILSTHTSLPEIGGELAYYFKDFEPDNMQKVLEESLEHYNKNPELAAQIIDRAKSFSWDDAAKKYLEVYRSIYK